MFTIYQTTNTLNGKSYIGFTTKTVADRWVKHKSSAKRGAQNHFHDAIKKHGPNVWTHKILCWGEDHDAGLKIAEPLMIELFPHEYNETRGGEGVLGYKHTESYKLEKSVRSMGNKNAKGTIHTTKQNTEHSRIMKGKPHIGARWTVDQRQRQSEKLKRYWAHKKGVL